MAQPRAWLRKIPTSACKNSSRMSPSRNKSRIAKSWHHHGSSITVPRISKSCIICFAQGVLSSVTSPRAPSRSTVSNLARPSIAVSTWSWWEGSAAQRVASLSSHL